MSAFGNVIVNREINSKQKPEVIVLKPDQILAVPQIYAELDLLSISTKDLNLLQNRHFVSINQVTGNVTIYKVDRSKSLLVCTVTNLLTIVIERKVSWYCPLVRLSIQKTASRRIRQYYCNIIY